MGTKNNKPKKFLAETHPDVAAEWHPHKNVLRSTEVTHGSHKKVWWKGKCHHEWQAIVKNRTCLKQKCPYCSNRSVLAGFNDLASKFPDIAREWHPHKNKQGPDTIMSGSGKRVWWLGVCGHEWVMQVTSRTTLGQKCPFCSGQRVLIGFNDLASKFPDIAREWHAAKNAIKATQVTYGSQKRVWWLCSLNPKHNWLASIKDRTGRKRGCPYCAGRKVLVGDNDLTTTHPDIAKEWHPDRNPILPTEVTYGSREKVWWLCSVNNNHEWRMKVRARGTSQNQGCPYCSRITSKKEQAMRKWIQEEFDSVIVLNNYPQLRKHGVHDIDVYLPEVKLGVEFNGLYWHSIRKKPDPLYHQHKHHLCREQGIELVQIWEDDWEHNRPAVLQYLRDRINSALGKEPTKGEWQAPVIEDEHNITVNKPPLCDLSCSFLRKLYTQAKQEKKVLKIIADASEPVNIPSDLLVNVSHTAPAQYWVHLQSLRRYLADEVSLNTFQQSDMEYVPGLSVEALVKQNNLISLYDAGKLIYCSR